MDCDVSFQLEYLRRIAVTQMARRDGEAIKYVAVLLVGVITLRHVDALPQPWRITTQILLGSACTTVVLLFGVALHHVGVPLEHESLVRQIKREESRSALRFTIFRCAAAVVVFIFLVVTAARGIGH